MAACRAAWFCDPLPTAPIRQNVRSSGRNSANSNFEGTEELDPDSVEVQGQAGEKGGRNCHGIMPRGVGDIGLIRKAEAVQSAVEGVEQPVMGHLEAAIPIAFGLPVVKFVPNADGFND